MLSITNEIRLLSLSLSLSRGRNIEDEKLGKSLDRRKQVNEPINRNRIDGQLIHGQGDLFDEAWPGLHERLSHTDGAVDYNVGHAIRNGESGKSKFRAVELDKGKGSIPFIDG